MAQRVVGEVEVAEAGLLGVLRLLAGLDRHCRSHNIAAECCVWSSGESVGLESRFSKAGGRVDGKAWSTGSCLMWSLRWNMWVDGDAGLAPASAVPCDSIREGAGVSILRHVNIRCRQE